MAALRGHQGVEGCVRVSAYETEEQDNSDRRSCTQEDMNINEPEAFHIRKLKNLSVSVA